MSDWRPVETAPKDGTIIDIWVQRPGDSGFRRANCNWDAYNLAPGSDKDGLWVMHYAECIKEPKSAGNGSIPIEENGYVATHWMPLPEPPRDSKSTS